MCAPIEGTDAAHLADCLGLDPTKFRGQATNNPGEELREEALLSSASVFDDDVLYKVCLSDHPCLIFSHSSSFVHAGSYLQAFDELPD